MNPSMVDDFEGYYGETGLLQAAYSTNVGSGCSANVQLTSDSTQHHGESYGLAFHYLISTEQVSEGWAGIIKALSGVDWSAYNAIQFWLKPDGKGQKLVIQIKTDGDEFEVNLSNLASESNPQLITIPFSQFKGKQNGVFNPKNIQHFAIFCNTIAPKNTVDTWSVDSTMYFDDIEAVNTNASDGNDNSNRSKNSNHSSSSPTQLKTYAITEQYGVKKLAITPDLDTLPCVSGGSAMLSSTVAPEVGDIISAAVAQKKPVSVEITVPKEALVQQLNSAETKSVKLVLKVPHQIAYNWSAGTDVSLILDPSVLQAAKQRKKDLTIGVVDSSTQKEIYSWAFSGASLVKTLDAFKRLDLALKIRPAVDSDTVYNALPAGFNNLSLSFANNGVLAQPATVSVNTITGGFRPGQSVYLYYYSPTTKLLESESDSPYLVNVSGFINIPISHCSTYVLLPQKIAAATSDTGRKLNVKFGKTYQFKIISAKKPNFVSGSGSAFQVTPSYSTGNAYFFKVTAVGHVGSSTGFYVNREKAPRTIVTIS